MTPCNAQPVGDYELLTGPGPAAIAVVRVRGAGAERIVGRHWRGRRAMADCRPGDVLRGQLVDADGAMVDELLLSIHGGAPQWDLRLHLHGSPFAVERCVRILEAGGLVPAAAAGADLWSAADALDREAYALLPQMITLRAARWLLSQPGIIRSAVAKLQAEDDLGLARAACRRMAARTVVAEWFSRPLRVAIVGPANAGKSTLVNALADQAVSVVSAAAGTTRDWVEAAGEVDGWPVVWIDTAGRQGGGGEVDWAAAQRTPAVAAEADCHVLVFDSTRLSEMIYDDYAGGLAVRRPVCIAVNKSDLVDDRADRTAGLVKAAGAPIVAVSAERRTGLDELGRAVLGGTGRIGVDLGEPAAFTSRQAGLLLAAADASDRKILLESILGLCSGAEGA